MMGLLLFIIIIILGGVGGGRLEGVGWSVELKC
jgi:hypothetical protein